MAAEAQNLAFLLTVPFDNRFTQLSTQREIFALALISAGFACIFLVTTSVDHRLHWRVAVLGSLSLLLWYGLALIRRAREL